MEDRAFLAMLQAADSGYPSGAYTLSHGLETHLSEGWLADGVGVADLIEVLLLDRAARADLPVLLAAHRLGTARPVDVAGLGILDRRLDTVKLAREEREGSARVGRRLLIEGTRLFPAGAIARYAGSVRTDASLPGHAAIAQGLHHADGGTPPRPAALAVAAGLAMGLATAAVRLGIIGHAEAQRLVLAAHPVVVAAVDRATAWDPADLRPSSPMVDIAIARHERADVRAFAS